VGSVSSRVWDFLPATSPFFPTFSLLGALVVCSGPVWFPFRFTPCLGVFFSVSLPASPCPYPLRLLSYLRAGFFLLAFPPTPSFSLGASPPQAVFRVSFPIPLPQVSFGSVHRAIFSCSTQGCNFHLEAVPRSSTGNFASWHGHWCCSVFWMIPRLSAPVSRRGRACTSFSPPPLCGVMCEVPFFFMYWSGRFLVETTPLFSLAPAGLSHKPSRHFVAICQIVRSLFCLARSVPSPVTHPSALI